MQQAIVELVSDLVKVWSSKRFISEDVVQYKKINLYRKSRAVSVIGLSVYNQVFEYQIFPTSGITMYARLSISNLITIPHNIA